MGERTKGPDETDVERVARAIHDDWLQEKAYADYDGWENVPPEAKTHWLNSARAAIAAMPDLATLRSALAKAEAEAQFLRELISRPYIGAWTEEIIVEAAHQRDRFGADHDHGKNPEDWFWLVGYLAGKALASHKSGDTAKAHHHTVSTGAVLAHWAASIDGDEQIFRPGLGASALASIRAASAEQQPASAVQS